MFALWLAAACGSAALVVAFAWRYGRALDLHRSRRPDMRRFRISVANLVEAVSGVFDSPPGALVWKSVREMSLLSVQVLIVSVLLIQMTNTAEAAAGIVAAVGCTLAVLLGVGAFAA